MKNVIYINAGAGSGKTYCLTKLLAEKLSDKEREIKPSQVILTTFTELAAAEFKEKSRQQIISKGNADVASQIDSASIGTVHSVALKIIKKFWYLLDYGADIQTISDRDEQFYFSQSLAKIASNTAYASHFDNFRKFRDHYNIVNEYSHPDYTFWQDVLKSAVEKMEYYGVEDVNECIAKSVELLNNSYCCEVSTQECDTAIKYLSKYEGYIKGVTTGVAEKQREALSQIKHPVSIEDVYLIRSAIDAPVGGATHIENNCPGYGDFIDVLERRMASASELEMLIPFVTSIFKLAEIWRKDVINYKKSRHIISYNDMEKLFLKLMMEEREVQDYIINNFKLVMVDEFQDSNPIQLKIFNKLSELISENGGVSYWVGDPKQAIYGFRGSDTELINEVAKQFEFYDDSKIHYSETGNCLGSGRLVESWRSRPQLVELVNKVFATNFQSDGIDSLCITLKPHFNDVSLELSPLQHWLVSANNKSECADKIANQIKVLLSNNTLVHREELDKQPSKISYKDVAVLCRSNNDCSDIIKSLRKIGLPVSEVEDDIMMRAESQLMVNLLQFVQNPGNKYAIANLLSLLWNNSTSDILKNRVNYIAANDNDKDEWMSDDPKIVELKKVTNEFSNLSIPEMVKAIVFSLNLPAIVDRWGDGIIRRQNLSTIINLAEEYDQMCLQMGLGSSVDGFIYYLNSVEPEIKIDNQSDTIKVMTYHKSKGLQWPVVILHNISKDEFQDSDFIKKSFMKVREVAMPNGMDDSIFQRKYYLVLFPKTLKTDSCNVCKNLQDNLVEIDSYKEAKQTAIREARRLMYVGMTRAKDCLVSVGYPENGNYSWLKNIGIINSSAENPWGLDEIKPDFVDVVDAASEIDRSSLQYAIDKKPESHTQYEKKYLSPSKLTSYAGFTSHFSWTQIGVEVSTKGWGDDYSTIGSCIHRIFAAYIYGDDNNNSEKAGNIIAGFGLTEQLMGHKNAILNSAKWLYAELQKKYPQTEGDTIDKEYPFVFTLDNGQILRGEIDLIWRYTDDNKRQHAVIVDYKSFPGVNFNAHTETHYPQLSAYVDVLKKSGIDVISALIYYPVHGIIHELR